MTSRSCSHHLFDDEVLTTHRADDSKRTDDCLERYKDAVRLRSDGANERYGIDERQRLTSEGTPYADSRGKAEPLAHPPLT